MTAVLTKKKTTKKGIAAKKKALKKKNVVTMLFISASSSVSIGAPHKYENCYLRVAHLSGRMQQKIRSHNDRSCQRIDK